MIEITSLQPQETAEAKQLIAQVVAEVLGEQQTPEQLVAHWNERGLLTDIDHFPTYYLACLVVRNDGKIVGTGAIRALEGDIAELKRMWLLPEYRGQGWGRKLADELLERARRGGFTRVRLDLAERDRQPQALRLYTRLGFREIERYNDSSCTVFLEKTL